MPTLLIRLVCAALLALPRVLIGAALVLGRDWLKAISLVTLVRADFNPRRDRPTIFT